MTLKTGRLVHHDPQSRQYEHPRRMIRPVSVLHRIDAPALDQNGIGACVGFAAAQWLNCRKGFVARKRYNYNSLHWLKTAYTTDSVGRRLYRMATQADDFSWTWPPSDNGSSGLGVAKALKAIGAIDRYDWTFSFAGFLAALQVQPVLVGTAWTSTMFDPDNNGIIRSHNIIDSDGGHEYLARGINWPRQLIRIRNSWSSQWGLNGDAYIPFTDMEKLLAAQGDCVVPIVDAT
jgi:hypothetical protein